MANQQCASVSETGHRYDVFLSFSGVDTRHGFTGNLYNALYRAGIETFMDDEELKVGEEIGPALVKAIEESKIAIVVFSENYADSTWCLDELAKIVQCHKEKKQIIIIPIFYKVEPSDVRHQKNSYGEAMTKHETRFGADSEKVAKWKSSLAEVSNSKGFHFREGYEYEYKLIQEIVSEASIKISPRSLDINEHIVGLDRQVEELKSLLEIESKNNTYFLGIHGPGGIGKTTLAKALYNSICDHFEGGSCFVFNVRETSKQFDGQKLLLQTLLTEILKEGTIHLASVDKGIKTMKRKLGQKRVLIVLDDVDDIKQLDIMAGGCNWFGAGSKIIITTRDKHLLDVHKVEKIYEMSVLSNDDSLELFCQNAFKTSHVPKSNYEDLSNRAIHYAKGLPLALKVLGSHLCMKELDEWKSALDKYEKSLHKDIQSILRISYDSLDSEERDIFLDIACFFKGKRLEYVKPILDACDFHSEDGIRVLVDKSLITIEDRFLMMHDLIQDMGREIVKEERPKEVGKRSRLWFHGDVLDVLTENTGSSKIEGILLDPPQREEIEWIDSALEKMKSLRILIVRNTNFSSAPSYLPNGLRLLDWEDYPSQSFPSGFCPKKIVASNLRGSPLIQPFQAFEHLTYMNVSNCCSITQIPNVSKAKNLRELKLDRCEELVSVDESVGFLPNLVYLSASECSKLRSFVPKIYLPSLEHLSFSLCTNLEYFPEIVRKMYKPLKIYLIDTSIKELPCSIGNLVGLEYVHMSGCCRLQYLPSSLFMLPNLITLNIEGCFELPRSFRRFEANRSLPEHYPSLQTLCLGNGCLLDKDLQVIIHNFPSLKELNVSGSRFVSSFPACIKESICLTSLDVSHCPKLEEIPELPSTVQKLNALHCHSLNAKTLGMLWFQVCKEINGLEVIMPETEIPEWFDHRNEGGIPVFEACGKFPVVAVAFVFQAEGVPSEFEVVNLQLFIERKFVRCKQFQTFLVADKHVLLLDLRVLFSYKEWDGLDALLHPHDWKTIHVVYDDDTKQLTLRSWGVYVYKQETNMDHIQFNPTSPYSHHHPSFYMDYYDNEISTKDMVEGFNLEKMFKRQLMMVRHLEENSLTQELWKRESLVGASLIKMTRRAMALREVKGSGFILHDEDDNEGFDNMVQSIMETVSEEEEEEEEEGGAEVVDYVLQWIEEITMKYAEERGEGDDDVLQCIEATATKYVEEGADEDDVLQSIAETILIQCLEGNYFLKRIVESIIKHEKEEEEEEEEAGSSYVPDYDKRIIVERDSLTMIIEEGKECGQSVQDVVKVANNSNPPTSQPQPQPHIKKKFLHHLFLALDICS